MYRGIFNLRSINFGISYAAIIKLLGECSQVTGRKLPDLVMLQQITFNDISVTKFNDQLPSFLNCRK